MKPTTIYGGEWWRCSRYELVDKTIRPAPGATVSAYDPWKRYWATLEGRVSEPPYLKLTNLLLDFPSPAEIRKGAQLSTEQEEGLLAWCSENGLIGLLPELVQSATFIGWEHFPDGTTLPDATTFQRLGDKWIKFDRDPNKQNTWPERSQVVVSRLGGTDVWFESVDQSWIHYFPWVSPEQADNYEFPLPLTEEFWRQYGEPLNLFVMAASSLAEIVRRLSTPNEGDFESVMYGTMTEQKALHHLQAQVRSSSPSIHRMGNGTIMQQWRSPSLLCAMSLMLMEDLAGDLSLYRCPCGRVVASSYPDTRYCSPKHREKYRKRAQREREKKRSKKVRRRGAAARPSTKRNGP